MLFAVELSLTLACGAGSACKPAPLAAVAPDASTSAQVCGNLARLGCALGSDPACVSRLELSIQEQRVTAAQVECARTATANPALAQCSPFFACGTP